MAVTLTINRLTITTSSWTAVLAPTSGNHFWLRNDNGTTKVRSNPNDANTEDSFAAGIQFVGMSSTPTHTNVRFQVGDVLCYLEGVANTGPVIVTSY